MDGFAQKYFGIQKKGTFIKKKIPIEDLVHWSKVSYEIINSNMSFLYFN